MAAALLGLVGTAVVGPLLAVAAREWVRTQDGGARGRALTWAVPVAAATGAAFWLSGWRVGPAWKLGPVLVGIAGLVAIGAVDIACRRVPTRFVAATGVVASAVAVVAAAGAGTWAALGSVAAGSVAYGGFLTLAHLTSPAGLGGGDARLAWLVGGIVGWATWPAVAPSGAGAAAAGGAGAAGAAIRAVIAAALLSIGIGLATHLVVALRRRGVGPLPFGPAIGAGALVVVLSHPY